MSHLLIVLHLQRRTAQPAITLAWEKDLLVFINVYTGEEWNKAIHNGLTLPLAQRGTVT